MRLWRELYCPDCSGTQVMNAIILLLSGAELFALADCKRNEIVRELQIPQITEFVQEYIRN
jgi:hypothetical protein